MPSTVVAFVNGRQHDDPIAVAAAIWAGAAALVALGIGQVVGGAIDRLRPYESMSDVHVLVARSTDFSFPSVSKTANSALRPLLSARSNMNRGDTERGTPTTT